MDLESEFTSLSIKFLFVYEESNQLNLLLNDLNSLDYRYQQISNVNVVLQFIDSLTKIPTTSDTNVVIKTCNLLKQLMSKQKIALPEPLSNKIVNWIIKTQTNRSTNIFICEGLDTLALLFRRNHAAAIANQDLMLASDGILVNHLKLALSKQQTIAAHDYTAPEIYRSTLSCIESILMHSEEDVDFDVPLEYLDTLGQMLIKFLYTFKQNEIHDNDFISITTLAINSLKFISQSSVEFSTTNLGELLGISKAFMLYGIVKESVPVKVLSSQQPIMDSSSAAPKNKKAMGLTPKSKKNNKSNNKKKGAAGKGEKVGGNDQDFSSFTLYRTSDSDFSDNEHSRELINRNKQSKLRLTALSLVYVLSSIVEKKIIFGYWHCLLSTDDSTMCTSLVNSVLKDTSPRCKIVALQTMIQLLKNSKSFLLQAENRDKTPTTFTPFSVTLGNMISFTYEKLTQAVIKEGDLTVLTQILKCLSVFISVTPFHRLKSGLVAGFIKYVRLLVRHKDPTIKVAALIITENLISLQDMTPEIYELVEIPKSKIEFDLKKIDESIRMVHTKDEDDLIELEFEEEEKDEEENVEDTLKKLDVTATKMSWLLQTVLENLGIYNGILKTRALAVSVRIQSLQVLTAMSSHFLLLKDHLMPISTALTKCFQDSPADEKLYASRTLESIGSAINNFLSQENKTQSDADLCLAFWIRLLPSVVDNIQNIQNSSNALRASLADALANIGVHIFEKLDFMKQTQIKSILTGCSYDEDTSVKSSAVRALAVCVLFPSLREDICFIENTTESVLRIMKEQNFVARTKASFGLANVVDCLLIIRESLTVNDDLLKQILETCLHAAGDNDRVKVNAVRTLGNSMVLLTTKHLESAEWVKLFDKSVKKLIQQLATCSNVKVKWNICYSLSSMMKNSLIFEDTFKAKWQESVFKALCNTIQTSPNFKVRTNACLALTVPSKRRHYDIHFIDLWNCLLSALEQSNNMTDFNEYKHRDALQDQICTAIYHLMSLALAEDVVHMKNSLVPLLDVTKPNWHRVINRQPPEYQNNVITACNTLKAIEGQNVEQKKAIQIIVECFQPIDEFYSYH